MQAVQSMTEILSPETIPPKRRSSAEDTEFTLVVHSLLGLGFSSRLVANGLASAGNYEDFASLGDIESLKSRGRVKAILQRMQFAETTFKDELSQAMEDDPSKKQPLFQLNSKTTQNHFLTRIVKNAKNKRSIKLNVETIRDTIIEIRSAEIAFPQLRPAEFAVWLKMISWTVEEFAAISLGRKPVVGRLPKAPVGSVIRREIVSYKWRLNQLRRAVALRRGKFGLKSRHNTPEESLAWAENVFSVHSCLAPRATLGCDQKQIKDFVTLLREQASFTARDQRASSSKKTFSSFKFRKERLFTFVSQVIFKNMTPEDFETHIWTKLEKDVAAKYGSVSKNYDTTWRSVKAQIAKAWRSQSNELIE